MSFLNKLFKVEKKHLNKLQEKAQIVESYKEEMEKLSEEELKAKTPYFKDLLKNGKTVDEILPEAFATCREAAKRVLQQYPYYVQILGAVALNDGDVAEMKTGEGKTLTSTMCIYLNALTGRGVHVVTVNDYLASRDANWMGAIYKYLGLSVGVNGRELSSKQKRDAFACDITYTTNSEIGFDYLRDNMVPDAESRVLRGLYMAVIDEADSILIDESRTPLIISGGKKSTANLYILASKFVKSLQKDLHYTIDVESKTIQMTTEGVHLAEKQFKVDNLYNLEHTSLVHHVHQALRATYIMEKDKDYVVTEGEIVIVDQFTGRMLKGRSFSDGLHQAIEAKEGVNIKEETSVMATITYQNFFRLYEKIGGMTGTAKTEEEEFIDIYNMRVIMIPTNKKIVRKDEPDLIFGRLEYKLTAMIDEIKTRHETGQPVLVGTITVEMSEHISSLLKKAGIKHEILNAKNHAREAEIIAKAGFLGSVTLATNMAGRGTDIKLGEGVSEVGGLAVIGSERHESRRIDNQLRGRAGRQGDPGYSRFYVSLEDDLMIRFGGEKVKKMFGMLKDQAIESQMLTNIITSSQQRVEGMNFDTRKNLLQYDDVLRQQRETMYKQRDEVIFKDDVHHIVKDLFFKVADYNVRNSVSYENKESTVDLEQLKKKIIDVYLVQEEFEENELNNLPLDQASELLYSWILEKFESRRSEWGPEIFRLVEKQILLRIIDSNWTQHIDKMSKLRDGIHLRAYAQTNPLQSYINEGYEMFQKMVLTIAEESVTYCLRARIQIVKEENKQSSTTPNKKVENKK